jgi:hypothetical protein
LADNAAMEAEPPKADRPKRKRRWCQFSLRTLFVVFSILIIWLGAWIQSAREQERAIKAIQQQCDILTVWYDDEFADEKGNGNGGRSGEFTSGVVINLRRKLWVPAVVQSRLGKDFFHDAISVAFTGARDQSDLFQQVARLGRLEQLTPHVSVRDEDIKRIAGLRRLKRLDLMDATPEFTDKSLEVLAQMPSIEALSICDASITDHGLAVLANMRQLKELTLGPLPFGSIRNSRFHFTDEGVAHLESLTNLVCLDLDCPTLSGEGLRHLAKLTKLKRLKLNGRGIMDNDLGLLASLPSLESLELRNATFAGIGFAGLDGLSKLEWLELEGPNITDKAIPFIARIPALYGLGIEKARLTAAGLEQLAAAPKLYQVQIRSPVSGDLKRLKQALPNRSLYIGGSFL